MIATSGVLLTHGFRKPKRPSTLIFNILDFGCQHEVIPKSLTLLQLETEALTSGTKQTYKGILARNLIGSNIKYIIVEPRAFSFFWISLEIQIRVVCWSDIASEFFCALQRVLLAYLQHIYAVCVQRLLAL